MVWPRLHVPTFSRALASARRAREAPARTTHSEDERVDDFSAGCVLGVVGLLYAVFLVSVGESGERLALAITASAVGAVLLGRCAWRSRRGRPRAGDFSDPKRVRHAAATEREASFAARGSEGEPTARP